jgi:SPP1 gp7 family putative phage head morphogenesis protein
VAKRTQSILGASDTVAQKIRESLGEGLDAGESIEQLAARVTTFTAEQYRGQARTIARTETASGYSGARTEAMREAGIPKHEWLSARDDRVRASHLIDAQVRVIGDPFSNGLMEPHDPSAPREETINCRCVTLPVVED